MHRHGGGNEKSPSGAWAACRAACHSFNHNVSDVFFPLLGIRLWVAAFSASVMQKAATAVAAPACVWVGAAAPFLSMWIFCDAVASHITVIAFSIKPASSHVPHMAVRIQAVASARRDAEDDFCIILSRGGGEEPSHYFRLRYYVCAQCGELPLW